MRLRYRGAVFSQTPRGHIIHRNTPEKKLCRSWGELRRHIACKRCEKACQYDAIHVSENCALITPAKCTLCGECVKVCPTKCIEQLLPLP